MQGDRQLDDAEARPEMPAGLGHRIDHLHPEFVGQLAQLVLVQPPQIVRGIDQVEQGRVRVCQFGLRACAVLTIMSTAYTR